MAMKRKLKQAKLQNEEEEEDVPEMKNSESEDEGEESSETSESEGKEDQNEDEEKTKDVSQPKQKASASEINDVPNHSNNQGTVEQIVSDGTYRNKQRVVVFSTRGVTSRHRHLLTDLRRLMPHHKKDSKLDIKGKLQVVNEIAEMKSCNGVLFLEARKRMDLYMWAARAPNGPSIKFLVNNVHTMDELRLTGNAMVGSRPFLSFDSKFNTAPHWQLIKAVLTITFCAPRGHPKSKPFVDRVMGFCIADGKIWVRNFQILDKADGAQIEKLAAKSGEELTSLVEIGPRFVLTPIRIFAGSFGGATLYQNPGFVSPNTERAQKRRKKGLKYTERKIAQESRKTREKANVVPKTGLESEKLFGG
mmetsp:Transcript_18169/g.23914  ORF Transcript_18169/g.23914 Transcript_18169/m.23914 type:complete len:362 (-) Transcript_18169:284-1369(-)